MKPSSKSLPLKQRSEETPRETQISTFNKHIYRYSYNLGMPNLGTRRKGNAAIFPANEDVRLQKNTLEILPQSSCDNHQKTSATPTFIDVAPASKIDIERKNPFKIREVCYANEMEIAHKRSQSIHSKCVNACQDKYENKNESLVSNKATKSVDPTQEECVIQDFGKDVETSGEFSPSIDKFCRAARVLGVCLPAKELYSCFQMQKGVCDNDEFSLKHKTLLRILNKRF